MTTTPAIDPDRGTTLLRWQLTLISVVVLLLTACSEPLPAERTDYAGDWRGPDMQLQIYVSGDVAYRRQRGHSTTTINAPLKAFVGDDFIVGIGPMTTTFDVTAPPHRDGEQWKMTVDGVELVRMPDARDQ